MSDYLVYRIYHKIPKAAMRLLGVVHAATSDTALEKAKRNDWKHCYCDLKVEIDSENWVAVA